MPDASVIYASGMQLDDNIGSSGAIAMLVESPNVTNVYDLRQLGNQNHLGFFLQKRYKKIKKIINTPKACKSVQVFGCKIIHFEKHILPFVSIRTHLTIHPSVDVDWGRQLTF